MIKGKRLIDANEIMNALENLKSNLYGWEDYNTGVDGAVYKVETAPTVDAVEVVRCKDCAYATCNPVKLTYGCRHPSGLRGFVNEGFYFCSYGERITNERKSD